MDEQRQLIVRVHMDCSIDHLSSHLAPAAALPLPDRCSQAGTVATKHPRGHEGRAGRPASEET
jgi:hypothetical protein